VGCGQGTPHSSPGMGDSDSSAGGLRLADGPGTLTLANIHIFQQADGAGLRGRSSADTGRVCHMAGSGAGCVLVEFGTTKHRRGDTFRQPAGGGRRGGALFQSTTANVGQANPVQQGAEQAELTYAPCAVASWMV
jgi:hypothetical protein